VWEQRGFFPELSVTPVITDLFNATCLREHMVELLGEENVVPKGNGQLALRFPREPGAPPPRVGPHIDGIYTPHNGVVKGTLSSFTSLVSVFLTDLTSDFAGNFTVWPGSHRVMETHFREHGIETLLEGKMPPIDPGEPLQIQARAGDAVIAHYQLLHGVAPNDSPRPRYATFFRITHPQHHEHRNDCLCDLWKEWPGLQGVAPAA
jgi:hypothetical protein